MASACMKRLLRERERLPKDSKESFANFKDENLRSFEAYIVGPEDSLYRHKFIKLKFDIPEDYPLKPPKVKFIQHTGDRIHPNLYHDGKVCLSILGTWEGPPWYPSMTIEGVLITIRSLLDNKPYLHEPRQSDNPTFNTYVQYNTWRWLLLDYLDRERDVSAKAFLQQYIRQHGLEMVAELERQKLAGQYAADLTSPYKRGVTRKADYDTPLTDLRQYITNSTVQLVEPSGRSQPFHIVPLKRKAPNDAQQHTQPKQKQSQPPCIIDLTDSP